MKILTPTTFRISQLWGNPAKMYTDLGMKGHNGIDFACPTGTLIPACLDGIVEYVGTDSAGGIGVYVIHPEHNLRSIYWHLQEYKVTVGQSVQKGDVLGISNNTGFSTGPHLHFGLKKIKKSGDFWINDNSGDGWNGSIDPFNYFTEVSWGVLIKDAKGQFVLKAQELLNLNGYNIEIDGEFKENMEVVVKKFQKDRGLVVDGKIGNNTIKELLKNVENDDIEETDHKKRIIELLEDLIKMVSELK